MLINKSLCGVKNNSYLRYSNDKRLMTKKKTTRPKTVVQEVNDVFRLYDQIEKSAPIVTMYLILKKEENGDLVIRRSINEMPGVGANAMYVDSMIQLLKENCKSRGIKLIDGRKSNN